jgi:pimeloyl-ACP methyl ester carboxylesterase
MRHQYFILLFLLCFLTKSTGAQQVPYGNNPAAGKYVNTADAKIYYEVYGDGKPLVLLHGGFFGYIDEYAAFIPEFSKHYKVIAIAARGHGKSEIGTRAYTQELFAQDVLAILNKESSDSATLLGFSAGANTALYLAAHYPHKVAKVAALAGLLNNELRQPGKLEEMKGWKYKDFKTNNSNFFAGREKLMPQPERAAEWLQQLVNMWVSYQLRDEDAKKIRCPVLIVGGDRDEYAKPENFLAMYRLMPNAQLLILPNTNHTDLIFKPAIINELVTPFLRTAVK